MIKRKIDSATPAGKRLISAKKSCKPPFAGPAPRDPRRKTALRAPAERENPAGIERRGRRAAARSPHRLTPSRANPRQGRRSRPQSRSP